MIGNTAHRPRVFGRDFSVASKQFGLERIRRFFEMTGWSRANSTVVEGNGSYS